MYKRPGLISFAVDGIVDRLQSMAHCCAYESFDSAKTNDQNYREIGSTYYIILQWIEGSQYGVKQVSCLFVWTPCRQITVIGREKTAVRQFLQSR